MFFKSNTDKPIFTLVLLISDMPALSNGIDPDQLETNWSGFEMFGIKYVNLYQQPGSSNLIGWKLEVSMAS